MNPNTSGSGVITEGLGQIGSFLQNGTVGFWYPIMYAIFYSNLIASLVPLYKDDHAQLSQVANRLMTPLWTNFLQTFQVGNQVISGVGNVSPQADTLRRTG